MTTRIERKLSRSRIEGARVQSEILAAIASVDPTGRWWWTVPDVVRALACGRPGAPPLAPALPNARIRGTATIAAAIRRMVADGTLVRRSADLPHYRPAPADPGNPSEQEERT